MFSASADLYDLIYARLKDYAAEASVLAHHLRALRPDARTILDVGCGTGEHARHLARDHGFVVEGLDLQSEFADLARRKNPDGRFWCANMVDFDLGRTYDAVICLFSAIGYVREVDALRRTLVRFAGHLAPGGVVVVEPWFAPGDLQSGKVFIHTAEAEGVSVCRMSHTTAEGRLSRLVFEYLIGRASGLARASETHELGLFTHEEMVEAFTHAGLTCDHDPTGLTGRGLYTGRRAG